MIEDGENGYLVEKADINSPLQLISASLYILKNIHLNTIINHL